MTVLTLANRGYGLDITTTGAAIQRWFAKRDGTRIPLLCEAAPPPGACFPLVPFGNRVRDNRFVFETIGYSLAPNTAWDRHYLHGDGWTSEWSVQDRSAAQVTLGLHHDAAGTPYVYDAVQRFTLSDDTLILTLSVINRGATALPFGLGWHPYFPWTPETTLQAPATGYWLEGADWLPTTRAPLPPPLTFTTPRHLPRHWVNNGFTGWNGRCVITWPERQLALELVADPMFRDYVLFIPDTEFMGGGAGDTLFAFEPMSHGIDAHHEVDDGGLQRLAPGQALQGTIRLSAGILEPGGRSD
ncbi:MAG: aldose 1-epimerase [Azospirillaceae bacterium]|nr:aldose 1-epimerase [Azospirillaceae bacterium]